MDSGQVPPEIPESLAANREELRRRSRSERVRPLWLWTGIVTGPVAFAIVRLAGILLLSHDCGRRAVTRVLGMSPPELATAGITVAGALVTIAGGYLSWRIWRWTSLRGDEVTTGNMPFVPFFALGGALLSAFFLFGILITGILALALSTNCQ